MDGSSLLLGGIGHRGIQSVSKRKMRREPLSSLESIEEGSDKEDRGEQSGANKHGLVTNELVE